MKTFLKLLLGLSSLALITVSCNDDEINKIDSSQPEIIVQFSGTDSTISESGALDITLEFNRPASTDGYLHLSVDTSSAKYINTTPTHSAGRINLMIRKGETKVVLSVSAKNNSVADGHKSTAFKIDQVSNGLMIGSQKIFSLKILDDETSGETVQSALNFVHPNLFVKENLNDWHELQIHVSQNAMANGSATIEAITENAEYGIHFITDPALANNLLTLTVQPGTALLKIKVKAVNDEVIRGNTIVKFKIRETSGNLVLGILIEDSVNILDDELTGLPKGYDIGGASWGLKKQIEYGAAGRISRIIWDSYTPHHRHHIDTYYYNDQGELARINTDPGQDLLYHYLNGRIVMEQKVDNGEIVGYTEYDYDQFGNVSGYQTHYLQPDQTFALSSITLLLYFTDGNLYKKLVYTPSNDPEDPYLTSTETYESYNEVSNDFGIEFVPGKKAQPTLPGSYRVESNGKDLRYSFSYEFRSDRKPSKRTVDGPNTFEIAAYHYY